MMTIRELCEKHTSLTSADIEKIENMARTIPYLANLEDADIFIDCLLPSGDAIVVAEANPKDSPSSYEKSVVGMIAYQQNEPAVARTFKVGVATKHMKALTQENTRVIQSGKKGLRNSTAVKVRCICLMKTMNLWHRQ